MLFRFANKTPDLKDQNAEDKDENQVDDSDREKEGTQNTLLRK